MVTEDDQPVEFSLTPGRVSDSAGLEDFEFALPERAWVFGNKAYSDDELEDVLSETGIHLIPARKHNTTRPLE